MTPNGKQTIQVLFGLEQSDPKNKLGFTAGEITEKFDGLPERVSPVMTVSSYLTHLARGGYVVRTASSDKTVAWWKTTSKGKKALRAA